MINLLLIALLLHVVFYKSTGVLSCGLFGYSGKVAPNMSSIKILGLYNISRGMDSAGIYIDKQVYKDKGSFKQFIEITDLPEAVEDFTVIGHTRKASVGVVNKDNAHPYVYNVNKKMSHVFVHNGTIKDWEKEFKKYVNADPKKFNTDSDALGLLMANEKFDFLKDYDGAATFMLHDVRKPGSLLIFKGASTVDKKEEGDRELYGLKTKDGMYISSMENSLDALNGGMNEIINFPTNTLIYIEKGEIVKEVPIKRVLTTAPVKKYNSSSSKSYTNTYSTAKDQTVNKDEDININDFKGCVYWHKGRYWRNGHLCMGPMTLTDKGAYSKDNSKEYWFYRGVLLDCSSKEEFKEILLDISNCFFNNISSNQNANRRKIMSYTNEVMDWLQEEYKTNIGNASNKSRPTGWFSGLYVPKFARKVLVYFKTGNCEKIIDVNSKTEWDKLSESEWNDAQLIREESKQTIIELKEVTNSSIEKQIKYLNTLPETHWLNFKWESLDTNAMHPELEAYYFEKAKEYKYIDEEDDDELQEEIATELSDASLSDFIQQHYIQYTQDLFEQIKNLFDETELRTSILDSLEEGNMFIEELLNEADTVWDKD